jgi:hypothetical protein
VPPVRCGDEGSTMRRSVGPLARRTGATTWRRALVFAAAALATATTGCRPVRFEATTNIPRPLITPIPVTVGLYVPEEFRDFVHKEERWGVKWEVNLGKAQTDGLTRLVGAMFERVVPLDSIMGAVVDPQIRAVIEPELEAFSFVTPRDAGAPFYAVSLKYRIGLYAPDGKLVESWPFTGYGSVENSGFGGEDPLKRATSMAMRDAGAKLAVEFRQQAMVRGLLPEAALGEPLPGGLARPDSEPASEPAAGPAEDGTMPAGPAPDAGAQAAPGASDEDSASGATAPVPEEAAPGESSAPEQDPASSPQGDDDDEAAPESPGEQEPEETHHFAALHRVSRR